jgi:uncharacterized protein
MGHSEIIQKVANFVEKEMDWLCAAHDFFHIQHVVTNARKIWKLEKNKGDLFIVEAASYLHESLDEKFFAAETIDTRKKYIREFLIHLWFSKEQQEVTMFIISHIGFGKSLERLTDFSAPFEFYIVEDADRLESIGAIAVARTFSYGGKKWRPLYNPKILSKILTDQKSYHQISQNSSSLHHFYEKLFLLKDLMYTHTAKTLAEPRHRFMELYVQEFLKEWNGEI